MELNMITIGERIRSRRKELGLKQTDIKQSVGISSGNLSEIENGNRTPSMDTLYRLSQILKCSIDWIVTGNSSSEENTVFSLPEDIKELLNYWDAMSFDDKEELLALAQLKYIRAKRSAKETAKSDYSQICITNEIA